MEPLTAEEQQLLRKIAQRVVQMRLQTPAVFFLESMKPLNFVGSQAMSFLQPIVASIFPVDTYDRLRTTLEKRESIEALIQQIEAAAASEKTA